jgi:hypothetical protein
VRDDAGAVIEAVEADPAVATDEFWRALIGLRDDLRRASRVHPRRACKGVPG